MAVINKGIPAGQYLGLSTDTKPTGVANGSTFFETDTNTMYTTGDGGTTWVKKGGRGGFLRHTIVEHPFGKDNARTTGVQFSDAVATTAQAWKTVEEITIEPPIGGDIVELEVGITWAQKSASTVKYVRGRVQARNKDGTWVTIVDDGTSPAAGNAYIEDAADASSYAEHTLSGRIETSANLDEVPLDIQVQVFPEAHATEVATGKVKSSSFVKITYDE